MVRRLKHQWSFGRAKTPSLFTIFALAVVSNSYSAIAELSIIGSWKTYLGPKIRAVEVHGDNAYLARSGEGLVIVDISDPTLPGQVSSTSVHGPALDLAMAKPYVFIATSDLGLKIVDTADPSHPELIGSIETEDIARSVALSGNIAYVADGDAGVQIIDISDAAAPRLKATVDTPGHALAVAIHGNFAFVADGDDGELQIIDISNPGSPTLIKSIFTAGRPHGVNSSGNHLFVANGHSGIAVLDIQNPAAPTIVDRLQTTGWVSRLALDGNLLLSPSRNVGLEIFDISDPTRPVFVGGTRGIHQSNDVAVWGNRAYIAAEAGLFIVDLATTRPVFRQSLLIDNQTFHFWISGRIGSSAVIQRSHDLRDWETWRTIRLGNSPQSVNDSSPINNSAYFYRLIITQELTP